MCRLSRQSSPRERGKVTHAIKPVGYGQSDRRQRFDPFVETISGLSNVEWGEQVWKAVANPLAGAGTGPFQIQAIPSSVSSPNLVTTSFPFLRLGHAMEGEPKTRRSVVALRALAGLFYQPRWALRSRVYVSTSVVFLLHIQDCAPSPCSSQAFIHPR